jgi:hypothetical protein
MRKKAMRPPIPIPEERQAELRACWISCDHIPRRSWPLFRAQDIFYHSRTCLDFPGVKALIRLTPFFIACKHPERRPA